MNKSNNKILKKIIDKIFEINFKYNRPEKMNFIYLCGIDSLSIDLKFNSNKDILPVGKRPYDCDEFKLDIDLSKSEKELNEILVQSYKQIKDWIKKNEIYFYV